MRDGSLAKTLVPGETEADDASRFLTRVSEVPLADIDLEYLAVNVLYGRGAMAKETKREAAVAIKTLRAILNDARHLKARTAAEADAAGEAG